MQRIAGRFLRHLGKVAIAASVVTTIGQANAQSLDCYDRSLAAPGVVSSSMAETCARKILEDNTTNDRHAIALYNAARLYVVLGEQEHDPARKAFFYDSAVGSIIESRDRAADTNVAFLNPWKKGDKRSQAAQMAANRFFVANRSYQLGKAYLELGKLGGSSACPSKEACFAQAAAELERDASARSAGVFLDDYVYLRATVYLAWGQGPSARKDLEFLRASQSYSALAKQQLGELFLADAQRQLGPPLSLSGLSTARLSFEAAATIPSTAIIGRLGVAQTHMLEAQLITEPSERKPHFANAAREFGVAVELAIGDRSSRLKALEGRGAALLELARLGEEKSLSGAIGDLEEAAKLDNTIAGAPAQLLLARALLEANREQEAYAAYADAERRFGADPRAALARAEQSFARGKQLYAAAELSAAREQFERALAESGWRDGRADAFYFLSAVDLRTGQNAIADADEAVTAGDGATPYRQQACLARIAAGGPAVRSQIVLPACSGSDVLQGLFYLRQAQYAKSATSANNARRLAQAAFTRARGSKEIFRTSPLSDALAAEDLAAFGNAVALGCSSAAGLDVPVDLDDSRVEQAKAFFVLHRVHACIAAD